MKVIIILNASRYYKFNSNKTKLKNELKLFSLKFNEFINTFEYASKPRKLKKSLLNITNLLSLHRRFRKPRKSRKLNLF